MTAYSFSQLIDFTRTSAGTFVGSNGLIQNSPQSRNLLTFTQEFDNAVWQKSNATATANVTVAPDGTATADKLAETATTSTHLANVPITTVAAAYTFSCYLKAAERNFAFLYHSQSNAGASINLTTGAIGQPSGTVAPVATTATNVGNGWWRLAITVNATAASNLFGVYVADTATAVSYAGTTGFGVFLWGAQLEAAATATDYTRNVGGLFPPRFDYDPVTLAPRGILIEEQRTNLLLRSEELNGAGWNTARVVVTPNTTVAPDGTTTGDTLTATVGTSDNITQTQTLAAAVHTFSIYVRATGTSSSLTLGLFSGSFLASSGQILSGPGVISGSGLTSVSGLSTTQWTRIAITTTSAVPAGSVVLLIYPGGGATVGAAIVAWGAQLEAGAFATSYIPTVASQATRTADQATIVAPMFAPWYNQAAGTFVAEFDSYLVDTSTRSVLSAYASGATSNNILFINAVQRQFQINNAGNQADLDGGTPSSGAVIKAAGAYAVNDFALSLGGAAVVTDPTGTVPTVDTLGIGISSLNLTPVNGHIRRITYYPVRLSNTQLQALTA